MKAPQHLTLLCVTMAAVASVSAAEPVSLFNGHNLDGWVVENGGLFSVVDGNLRVDRGTGWLRSESEFADFTLMIEFRFLEPGANSGVFVRTGPTSRQDANGWPDDGYQVQCMDAIDVAHPLGTLIPYGGAGNPEQECDIEALRRVHLPTGEWHTFVIRCLGEFLTVELNGERITNATGIGNLRGHVGIQGEHGLLEFRRIAIVPEI